MTVSKHKVLTGSIDVQLNTKQDQLTFLSEQINTKSTTPATVHIKPIA